MTLPGDQEIRAWRDDWTATADAVEPAQALRRHVRRHNRLVALWAAGDAIVGLGFFAFLSHRALTHPDPVERVAMGLLAAIALGAFGAGYWNWRGARAPLTETTATFLAVSERRCRVFRRAVGLGWMILVAEALVFVPWLWHHVGPPSARAIRPWALLGGMLVLGVLFVSGLDRWGRREARVIDGLRRELGNGP